MSTDYTIACDVCKVMRHAGQNMGGINSFGYGSKDKEGRDKVAAFMVDHSDCSANGTRIMLTDPYSPDSNFYKDLDDEEE